MKFLICGIFLVGCISAKLNENEDIGNENEMEGGILNRPSHNSTITKDLIELGLLLKGDLSEAYILKQLKGDRDALLKYHYLKKHFEIEPLKAYLLVDRFTTIGDLKILAFQEKMVPFVFLEHQFVSCFFCHISKHDFLIPHESKTF